MVETANITTNIRHTHPQEVVATGQASVKVVSLVTLGMTSHQPTPPRDLSIPRVSMGNISVRAGSLTTKVAPRHPAAMEAHPTLGRNMAPQEVRCRAIIKTIVKAVVVASTTTTITHQVLEPDMICHHNNHTTRQAMDNGGPLQVKVAHIISTRVTVRVIHGRTCHPPL